MPLDLDVPPVSGITWRLFARAARYCFRRHFHAVRVANAAALENASLPLILYSNHCAWWDPMLCLLMARELMAHRRHYAPVDAAAIERTPLLGKIGAFAADTSSPAGVSAFLNTSEAILRDGGVLWVTPQGRPADVREFPLRFRPALALLAARVPDAFLLPLAIEYTFWDERLPETLVRAGAPFRLDQTSDREQTTRKLETALSAAMLHLQQDSCERAADRFRTVLTGRKTTGSAFPALPRLLARKTRPTARANPLGSKTHL